MTKGSALRKSTQLLALGNCPSGRRGRAATTALCALMLVALLSLPALAQSVSFAGLQTTVPASGLNQPYAVTVDTAGDVFIADTNNNRVVELPAGCAGGACQVTVASGLNSPQGLAVDSAGDVFIGDTHNNRVVEVPAGCSSSSCQVAAGSGLNGPAGMAVDGAGDVFIADFYNNRIVEVPVGCLPNSCQNVLGSGLSGAAGVAVDGAGDVFVADYFNNRVVEIPLGCTSSSCQNTFGSGLSYPAGVALDQFGNIFIADSGNNRVVEVPVGCSSSSCQSLVGSGLSGPLGLAVAVDASGDVFIADTNHSRVVEVERVSVNFGPVKIGASSTITLTYNVNSSVTLGSNVNALTQGAPSLDFSPAGTATCTGSQTSGNTCTVTVSFAPRAPGLRMGAIEITDSSGNLLATTFLNGQGVGPALGFVPGAQTTVGSGFSGPVAVADAIGDLFVADAYHSQIVEIPFGCTSSSCQISVGSGLNQPYAVALDGAGSVYIADTINNRVLKVPAGCTSSNCQINVASDLNEPQGLAVDGGGNLFIGDTHNNRVVRVPAGCTSSACQTTVGSGLNYPAGLAVDAAGDLFVADFNNNRVVEVPVGCTSSACQITVATGLNGAAGVAVDAAGDVFIADYHNARVLEVPVGCASSSCQSTVGSGLSYPAGVTLDGAGDIFIADTGNSRVVELLRSQAPSLSFPSTAIGNSSTPQVVTVQNIGNMKLGFSSIAASANFTVDSGTTTCSTSLALAPGASCNVGVASTPKVAGNLGGTLALNDNALNANATQTVGLAGSGTGLTISPSNVNFGTVNLFTLNETTVTVTNNGSSTVTINGASVAPGTAPAWAFPVISWCWGPLAPGKSCQIWVFYFADAVGTRTATLDITDSAPGSPQQVGLTANVINPIAQLNPFSVNFGYQNVGSQTTWPVKLTNVGQTNLNISGYGFVGDNPHDFSESNNCPSSLSPSASCTINVTFAPAARGYRDAVLVINDNVAGGQTWLWVQGGGH